jgi:ferredoxin
MTVKVKIDNLDRTIDAEVGENLRDVLLDADVDLYPGIDRVINCRGKALCGTCQIEVVEGAEGLSDFSLYERFRIFCQDGIDRIVSRFGVKRPCWFRPNRRLACQARIYRDAVIRTMVTPGGES